MKQSKAKNEHIKRKYFEWLSGAKGYSKSTVESIEKALWVWDEFAKDADYKTFNQAVAQQFKKWLLQKRKKRSADRLSLTTQYHILRYLHAFFLWLSGQPGYKSRVSAYDVQFLKLDKAQSKIATSTKEQKYPSHEYVKKLCASINIVTELDQRDRALIAFHYLSAMRVGAILSLPLGCFDSQTLQVHQDPRKGVKTKFSKTIHTTLLQMDDVLLQYILDWVQHLKEARVFSDADPLFPRTKLAHKDKNNMCFEGIEVEPKFWRNQGPILTIFKSRAKSANLEYFSPHKFRHAAIAQSRKHCRTEEQRKALSQNVGHDNIGTTFSYGNMAPSRVNEVISKMPFKEDSEGKGLLKNFSTDALLKEIQSRSIM